MTEQSSSSRLAKRTERDRMKALRSTLQPNRQAVSSLHQNLHNYLTNRDISAIFCYLSTADEVPSWALVEHYLNCQGVTVTCPRILDKQTMVAVEIKNTEQIEPGPLGIFTSTETTPYPDTIDVALVPGLAFTITGNRLGYGGGFYDRWFEQYPTCERIALCFEAQIIEHLTTEPHDIAMHAVVTERQVYRCGAPASL